MKKDFSNIILLSDMDGTLIDSWGIVSERNKEAIEYFVKHQGKFGVATGRTHMNGIQFLEGVPINIPCILFNGGMLYDFELEEVLEVNELPKEKLLECVRRCITDLPNITLHIYSDDMCYIVSEEVLADKEVVEDHQPNVFASVDDTIDKPWIKMLFSGSVDDLKSLEALIDDYQLGEDVKGVYSQDTYFELLPRGVSKGSMIQKLREHIDGDFKIYAIGDYYNDMELIKDADVGIATANALDELKMIADKITVSNDESAVADVIYNLL